MNDKQMYIISSEYDYSPVVVYIEEYGVIYAGDNSHNSGYTDFADGFSAAYTLLTSNVLKQISIQINDEEDLEEYKEILEKTNSYEDFKDSF